MSNSIRSVELAAARLGSDEMSEWTEGVCGDGAAILRGGRLVPISELLAHLNRCEAIRSAALEEAAKVIIDNVVADGSRENRTMLVPRNEGNISGLGYATAIRALKDKTP